MDMEIGDLAIAKQVFSQITQLRALGNVCRNDVVVIIEGTDRHQSEQHLCWNLIISNVLFFG